MKGRGKTGDWKNKEKRKGKKEELPDEDGILLDPRREIYDTGKFYRLKDTKARTLWTETYPDGRRMEFLDPSELFLFIEEKILWNSRYGVNQVWRKVIKGDLIGWIKGGVFERVDLSKEV